MQVFIAGATGVLGRRLIPEFRARGHTVLGLVRSPDEERLVQSLGGESRRADLFDVDALARAAEGAAVVIHAASATPLKPKPAPSDWETDARVRRDGARALAAAAAQIGAQRYVQQSVVWVARPPNGSAFDEDSPTNPGPASLRPSIEPAIQAEQIAREAGERAGYSVAVLRCGMFYGADDRLTRQLGEALRARQMPIVDSGDAIYAPLHLDDAATAFVAGAEATASGTWHVVDDQPVTMREFLTAFAERLGAEPPRRVPGWLARVGAGAYVVDFATASTRTSNARFRQAVGWAPRYPSYREGLDQVVAAWRAEGLLPAVGSS